MNYFIFEEEKIYNFPRFSDFSYSYNHNLKGFEINIPDGILIYIPNFLSKIASANLFCFLTEFTEDSETLNQSKSKFKHINWLQPKVKIFGKEYLTPRLTAWYGDEEAYYSYSGLKNIPNPWNSELLKVKEKIESISSCKFNSVLLNWYRNGNDSMGIHADNEKELGENPTIASLSIGADRTMVFKHNENKNYNFKFNITDGSLLIMKGRLQDFWKHAIPKQLTIRNPRLNLTFRDIKIREKNR
jgi:alkylated DNA repair dioxygenase AlkB